MPKFISPRPVQNLHNGLHLLRNRRTLLQMGREVLRGRYHVSWITKIIGIIAAVYVIFPFDFIPDYIPVLGWIDDGLVLYLVLKRLVKETQRYNRFKAIERKGPSISITR